MGFLTHQIDRSELKPGDHIYSYRAMFTYSHHGIYVGGLKVVHFTRREGAISSTSFPDFYDSTSCSSTSCPIPDCGFRQPNSGVVITCLDCFLDKGSLFCFEYEVKPSIFLVKMRGGTCTTAIPDTPELAVHRAMYLLQNGFGKYDIFQNNCEDFALYCKTGLLTFDTAGVGRSGQVSSLIGAPMAAVLSSSLKLLIPTTIGVGAITTGIYSLSRYATDIGVRSDVIKVAVEDLAVSLGWGEFEEENDMT